MHETFQFRYKKGGNGKADEEILKFKLFQLCKTFEKTNLTKY
jgi:hypothetical protein